MLSFSRLIGVAAVVVAVTSVASGAALSASSRSVATNLPAAAARVDSYAALPKRFVAPGAEITITKARGRLVYIIPVLPEAAVLPSVDAFVGGIEDAAKTAGLRYAACPVSGNATDWSGCFAMARSRKASAIVIAGGTPPATAASLVADARKSGIAVIAAHVPNPADFSGDIAATYAKNIAGLTATVPAPYATIGKLLADSVIADRPTPAGRFVIITSSDIPASAGLAKAAQDEFAANCGPACTVDTVDLPYAKWKTDAIQLGTDLSLAKTTITFVPLFDKVSALLAEGIRRAQVAKSTVTRPRIHSYGGTPFAIQLGQDNNRVEGIVGESMNWLGWAAMDQVLRLVTGNAAVGDELTGVLRLDDGNWANEGNGLYDVGYPPVLDLGWGDPRSDDGWITGYRTLWGLEPNSTGPTLAPGADAGGD